MENTLTVRARLVYVGMLALALLLLALILMAPWLVIHGYPIAGVIVYSVFAPICHQQPERSFHTGGLPLAVCARCFGIYSGSLLGLLCYPSIRRMDERSIPPLIWLFAALALMALDAVGGATGIITNTRWSRAVIGALSGAVVAFYILPGMVSAVTSYLDRSVGTPRPLKDVTSA